MRDLDHLFKDAEKLVSDYPVPVAYPEFTLEERPPPPEVIHGVLHKGAKMLLAGPSKSFKTWSFLDMCYCLATGKDWWGFGVEKSRVLYTNMELQEYSLQKRLNYIREHYDPFHEEDLSLLNLWNLRGHVMDISVMESKIIEAGQGYDALCIDPIYMLNVEDEFGRTRDENSAAGMAQVFRHFEKIARETGAAIIIGHHFRKGGPGTDALERASGSGVFQREPDSIVSLEPHSEPDCFVGSSRLRNFPQIDEFGLEFTFPVFKRNDELDITDLKGKPGAKSKFNLQEFVALVPAGVGDGITWSELKEKAKSDMGMESGTTFDRWFKKAMDQERLKKSPSGDLILRNK